MKIAHVGYGSCGNGAAVAARDFWRLSPHMFYEQWCQAGLAVMESSMALMVSELAGLIKAPVNPRDA